MKIHSDLMTLASRQDDVVGVWQLVDRGWTKDAVDHRTAGLPRLFDGVVLLGASAPTQRQRWRAATLTAPGRALSHASGGTLLSFWRSPGRYEVVTCAGSGGPRRFGNLLVMRSSVLDGYVTTHDGIPVTTGARTLWDLTPSLRTDRALRRVFREVVRLGVTTPELVRDAITPHPRRPGSHRLGALVDVYIRLPIRRCRSDAEAMALEVLDAAGVVIPQVNERFAGEEADFCWPELRLIIEIDGPDYHQFKDEDARKTAIWRAAGYEVRRIPSGDVYDRPERLLALAPRPA
jgi:hypothetical protein